jgi:hypothetical protein
VSEIEREKKKIIASHLKGLTLAHSMLLQVTLKCARAFAIIVAVRRFIVKKTILYCILRIESLPARQVKVQVANE